MYMGAAGHELAFLVPHLGAFSVFEASAIIAFIQIWDIIMYLTNRFKAKIERIKAESKAQGRIEGLAQARAEVKAKAKAEAKAKAKAKAYQACLEWYQRLESAKARGVPFDEPPPFLKGNKTEE